MSIEEHVSDMPSAREVSLQDDPRWLLIQRMLKTDTFQRAEQLRKILSYVSRAVILEPDRVLREYDIAFYALGRRRNFDPSQDNIVRVQFKNLRQRIERYFVEEGKGEPLVVTIPKGSYLPVFLPRELTQAVQPPLAQSEVPVLLPLSAEVLSSNETLSRVTTRTAPFATRTRWIIVSLALVALTGWMLFGFYALRSRSVTRAAIGTRQVNPSFLSLLGRLQGPVTVVVPDTSEMMISMISGAQITAEDYASRSFPEKQLALVKDPGVRNVLQALAQRKNTAAGEVKVAIDLIEVLKLAGVSGSFRYARDLHVRDFNQDNTILIGSHNSNPWVTLFENQMNFRMVYDPATDRQYFINVSPLPGEQPRYALYRPTQPEHENYVDIAFIPNVAKNGFMLFIAGSDSESAEAAVNYLLFGHLSPEVTSLLKRKDQQYFEIFLRGRHLIGESDDSLQLLSVRSRK